MVYQKHSFKLCFEMTIYTSSGMISVTEFLKFPIFRKIDVFRKPVIPDFNG